MPRTIKYLMYLTSFPWPLNPEPGEGLSLQGELRYQRTWPAVVLLEFQLLVPVSSQGNWTLFFEPQKSVLVRHRQLLHGPQLHAACSCRAWTNPSCCTLWSGVSPVSWVCLKCWRWLVRAHLIILTGSSITCIFTCFEPKVICLTILPSVLSY